jgi:hypothetical protein
MNINALKKLLVLILFLLTTCSAAKDDKSCGLNHRAVTNSTREKVRVFIFAGQSNMVGADSKVANIKQFPPFRGLESPQKNVLFSYCLGRENKTQSDGWVALQPVNGIVGPELSFARRISKQTKARIAIIKCAAGGTHLGGDWNPDQPTGFKMYPLTLERVQKSLAELEEMGLDYQIDGFMWHQGENDMFVEDYMPNYGKNLANFIARWRQDLKLPKLKFYIGELCTKTIWGMDLRPRMYAISQGQKSVTRSDAQAEYVPTSHVGVEIGGGVGLHYHYGTLGQLQHGLNYADAYLRTIDRLPIAQAKKPAWPAKNGKTVRLFVLAGHRNMEGERAFVQELAELEEHNNLLKDNPKIAFRYSLGGGYKQSDGWQALAPVDYYDTFGPELSFGKTIQQSLPGEPIAIAKFTHSGTQIIDWTPEGSMAKDRNIYPRFITFVKNSMSSLADRGYQVELAGVFYHVGENDMSMPPYRKQAAAWIQKIIQQSRKDLSQPGLRWYVSQQPPTDDPRVNSIDVTADLIETLDKDPDATHIQAFQLPKQSKKLVISTAGIVALGKLLANEYLKNR